MFLLYVFKVALGSVILLSTMILCDNYIGPGSAVIPLVSCFILGILQIIYRYKEYKND